MRTTEGHPCGRCFATSGWHRAWERATVEPATRARVLYDDGAVVCALRLVRESPLWTGYERDASIAPVWRGPVAYLSSVYAVANPLNQLVPDTAVRLVGDAVREVSTWDAHGLVVTNLEPGPVQDAVLAAHEPDARVRLDATCRLSLPSTMDEYLAALDRSTRTEMRRRHRRAGERGVSFHTRTGADARARLDEYVELTTASARKHGTPPLYDVPTLGALLDAPGTRLYTAEHGGSLLAGIVALTHERCVVLWSGGIRYSAMREYSPYIFLLYEIVAQTIDAGMAWVDFGRGNLDFKRRHGFVPVDLTSAIYLPDGSERAALRERLRTMHRGIAAFLEAA
jgi:hypothetical protein